MDAAKEDDVGVGLRGLIAQAQRVADEIRDVLDLGHLVIVREDDGVALPFQLRDFLRRSRSETEVYTTCLPSANIAGIKPDLQTSTGRYRLGFIGAGKLAGSVIRGLLRAKFCTPPEIIAREPNDELRSTIEIENGIAVTANNLDVAQLR